MRELIAKYADHIDLPIQMEGEKWEDSPQEGQPGRMVKTGEWETVNQATALWARPRKDITDAQYEDFYKHLAHDWQPPLAWSHNRVEGNAEYTQLLYIPQHATQDLWDRTQKTGIKLYVRRVFIMDDAEQLLPRYLRFVKGVVDSADLPLNVSRELLQQSRDVKAIREGNTRRVLSMLPRCKRAGRKKPKKPASRKTRSPKAANTPFSGAPLAPCSRKGWAKTLPSATACWAWRATPPPRTPAPAWPITRRA